MHRILVSFCLFLCLSVSQAFSQSQKLNDPKELFGKLKETSKNTQTIKASFTEEKFSSDVKEPIKSTGMFYYKKDKKLRWEKIKPVQFIFLVSGDKARIKEDGKEKNISSFNESVGKIKDLMLILVNGEFQDNKMFRTECYKNGKNYQIKLFPKNKRMAKVFDYVFLTFSGETMRLKEMDFFEKNGDKSEMKFYNDVVNVALEDKLFENF